ncbi:MAG: XisI protein [Nostoc sp. DedVER02]|uniref:XisI protein n=1 Tax=unclassified Nostoc TaxID=2593658 RepID=UPI002AD4232A|nr:MULTISPECIES: XisI protein [unclassified Nostoc]MDZ7986080.1 XisI protein [Nostoc sp. DedVER02]MDZ8114288.1 XisI protein [Nostoc sp. DedVER01b]
MEKIERYRTHIKHLLTEYAKDSPSDNEVETELVFDTERDHYQVVYTGWKNRHPMYGCVLHLDIKNNKIWIQHDGTEIGIANELVNLGIPKEDIVLAFHEPLVRQYTGFAVG